MKTSISFLKSKYTKEETIDLIGQTDADYIHVDIMDGKFVKNKCLPVKECVSLLSDTKKRLDVHLMVKSPIEYIKGLKDLNIKYLTIHVEIKEDISALLLLIKSYGIKPGLAINPETSIRELEPYLNMIDYIIVMGVHPGAGGQELIPECITKVSELKKIRKSFGYHYEISLDGGVNDKTIRKLKDLDVAISGSFICMSDDYQKQIDILR